jgi:hypothetical protein
MITSQKNNLIIEDIKKIGITALYVGGSAIATYAIQELAKIDYGVYTPLIMAGLNILAVLVKKYLTVTKY